MIDFIILFFVFIVILFAIKGSIKHFKGEGPCCGGGSCSKSSFKKLDGPVLGERIVRISGMYCQGCADNVEKAVNSIPGAVCRVDIKNATASISYDRTIEETEIYKAVSNAGYKVEAFLK